MDKTQLRDLIRRVLKEADLWSESAEELLMLTAATESNLGQYIRQVKGPALGIFQMEPNTHDDIWENYLGYRDELVWFTEHYAAREFAEELEFNLAYAILMARIHYLRVPESLPEPSYIHYGEDRESRPHPMWIQALAAYWKDHYNTHLGAGTVDKAVQKYERYVS